MKILVAALTVSVAAGLAGAPKRASACGNSYYHEVHPRVRQLQIAERDLDTDRWDRAGRLALSLFPKTREKRHTTNRLELRARRILALVVVRSGGKWPKGSKLAVKDEAERAQNLRWATEQLKVRAKARSNPQAQTELAEALARSPATRVEAEAILERLAQKRMVTSAHGLRTLAELRHARGDAVGRDAALKRCRAVAAKKNMCTLTPGSRKRGKTKGSA